MYAAATASADVAAVAAIVAVSTAVVVLLALSSGFLNKLLL